ncbi:hypothetical protein E4T49_06618 [Aureobasidium sp. EXF-10728]|nr:hypothetical protein E4T49_06618 [Aureobasidium sp. EXF-10728]
MSHLTGDPKRHDLSSFKDSITGSCLCGSITVTINDNLFTKPRGHLCHCENCRKATGSVVATNLTIEEDKVDIQDRDGTLKLYADKATKSGNPVYRYFCAVDGNPIFSKADHMPGKVTISMGCMPVIPTPEMAGFAAHRHPWFKDPEGIASYKIMRGEEKMDE